MRLPFVTTVTCPEDLLVFYHPETLREIGALRAYLLSRAARGNWTPSTDGSGWLP